eukprot:160108-Pyramimonas_sp.AAC.1
MANLATSIGLERKLEDMSHTRGASPTSAHTPRPGSAARWPACDQPKRGQPPGGQRMTNQRAVSDATQTWGAWSSTGTV